MMPVMNAPTIGNKYPGTCRACGAFLAIGAGLCEKVDGKWVVRCAFGCQAKQATAAPAARPAAKVGDMAGILALFGKAKAHLKFPAIVLSVGDEQVRLNVAGEKAKVPGSLTVVTADRDGGGERAWLGRILLDGTFQASKAAAALEPWLTAKLKAFSAEPAKVAGEDGRLHGRCCFCRIALKDERSTMVGYGPVCADHYGLPWGEKPAEFAGMAAEREMQLMEAEGDRVQTALDEEAKRRARAAMEGVRW